MNVKFMLSVLAIASSLILSGCATSDLQTMVGNGSAVSNTNTKMVAKNPKIVKIYFGNQGLPKHYKIIGHVTASHFTAIGTSYSQQSIAEELKKQAASIGGTGVMNVATGMDRSSGDVVLAH